MYDIIIIGGGVSGAASARELSRYQANICLLEKEEDVTWQLFGLNITDEKRKATFLKVLNKYVYYKDVPMTEAMLIEHNWSFREIGEFLFAWSQISD